MPVFELDENFESGVNIKVIGVGGAGNNAVSNMIIKNVRGVEFITINTDKQALEKTKTAHQIAIGGKLTKGHGAGANPDIGRQAAEESIEEIEDILEDADMVFITAGMGGGTGTGAAPVVAKAAQKAGILTVAIVTKPFLFEGPKRMAQAEKGIQELSQYVDSLIVIPNEKLKQVSEKQITFINAFQISDDVLCNGVRSISDLISVKGYINLDFADVTAVMKSAGYAHMGIGSGTGKDKATAAAKEAISSPLLETNITGASGILFSITASPDIGLEDIDVASNLISSEATQNNDATVIFGVTFDAELEDTINITLIATGFAKKDKEDEAAKETAQNLPSKVGSQVPKAQAKPTPEPQPEEEEEDTAISEKDFSDIMDMLRKPKNNSNQNNSNQNNQRRY